MRLVWRPTFRMTAVVYLLLVVGLVLVAFDIWATVRAPGHPLNYAQLAWALLLTAFPISMLLRSVKHMSTLIVVIGNLAGVVVNLWGAAQGGPVEWVNYVAAALLLLLLLALWFVRRWARTERAGMMPRTAR